MARLGRKDRGLLSRTDSAGKSTGTCGCGMNGREKRFGSFPTKTKASEFYERAKLEQHEGRFQPDRYHRGGHVLGEELLTRHGETTTVKNQAAEKPYMRWWTVRLKGIRVNHSDAGHDRRRPATHCSQNIRPQTVVHYLKSLRHVLNQAVRDGKLDRNPFAG